MKKLIKFLSTTGLVLGLMILAQPAMAQTNSPNYTLPSFQAAASNINSEILNIIGTRFNDFTNAELHKLALLSDEKKQLTRASEAAIFHQKISTWKANNLTANEIANMPMPSLQLSSQ